MRPFVEALQGNNRHAPLRYCSSTQSSSSWNPSHAFVFVKTFHAAELPSTISWKSSTFYISSIEISSEYLPDRRRTHRSNWFRWNLQVHPTQGLSFWWVESTQIVMQFIIWSERNPFSGWNAKKFIEFGDSCLLSPLSFNGETRSNKRRFKKQAWFMEWLVPNTQSDRCHPMSRRKQTDDLTQMINWANCLTIVWLFGSTWRIQTCLLGVQFDRCFFFGCVEAPPLHLEFLWVL